MGSVAPRRGWGRARVRGTGSSSRDDERESRGGKVRQPRSPSLILIYNNCGDYDRDRDGECDDRRRDDDDDDYDDNYDREDDDVNGGAENAKY